MPLITTHDFDCWYTDYFGPAWREPQVVLIKPGSVATASTGGIGCPDSREPACCAAVMRAHGGSSAGAATRVVTEGLARGCPVPRALGLEARPLHRRTVGGITGIVLGARHPDRFHSITLDADSAAPTPSRRPDVRSYESWSKRDPGPGSGGWTTQNLDADDPRTAWERAVGPLRHGGPLPPRRRDPAVDVTAYVAAMRTRRWCSRRRSRRSRHSRISCTCAPPSPTPSSSSSKARPHRLPGRAGAIIDRFLRFAERRQAH